MRGEVNVAKALLLAEAALDEGDGDQPPPDREVDNDWLYRWRDSASTVSNEELQEMWGRVLAGEVKAPGTFSLRTLEFMKNLSPDEAGLIAQLAPFVIRGQFVFRDKGGERVKGAGALEPYGISFDVLAVLDDMGVINFDVTPGVLRLIRIPSSGLTLLSHDRLLFVVPGAGEDATLELPIYRLTPVGSQVLGLGSFTANESYLRSVGEAIKEMGFKVSLATHDRERKTDSEVFPTAMEEL